MSEIIASMYEVIEKIGSGGGGVVYLANHLRLGKKVILKADKRKVTAKPEHLRREVDILKELSHSYIPQVYDFFSYGDTVYTVMEYIEGESLDKPLKRGERFSQPQVIAWAKQLLEALDYLHSPIHGNPPRGYVHSDIKPANIMRTPSGDISLIDFNIALAIGEESMIGRSSGYASPEHYGLDFSSDSKSVASTSRSSDEELSASQGPLTREQWKKGQDAEEGDTSVLAGAFPKKRDRSSGFSPSTGSTSGRKAIVPDVRSDIYSLGATLYHLLSGIRPAQNAREVIRLSEEEFSPQIVRIIAKAMNPNPDLRYQTAKEMLYDFSHLHENDIRIIRWKKRNVFAYSLLSVFLILGIVCSFIGLKRIQMTERWLRLTEDAQNLYQKGDRENALKCIMDAYSEQDSFLAPEPLPTMQERLTEILGTYDLSDDFKLFRTLQLPSAPLDLKLSSDGKTAACICSGSLEIIEVETAAVTETLPAEKSALAEVEYLDENRIVYAGSDGIITYDITQKKQLWNGERATAIAVSGDGNTVASVYKDNDYAMIYDVETGNTVCRVDFGEKRQKVAVNDIFVNPSDNLFCLNDDGSKLAVSFSDGSLQVIDLRTKSGRDKTDIFDDKSGYDHYEGGFYQQYLAFSATNDDWHESVFAVLDADRMTQTGGFSSEGYYFTGADRYGIVVGVDNILVQLDPVSGEQRPLVDTTEKINQYSRDSTFAAIASGEQVFFFDKKANEISSLERNVSCDFLELQGDTVIIGSSNSSELWIMKYESHTDSEIGRYDPEYEHDEARLNADSETLMLFSYNKFRIYDLDGRKICEVEIPDADNVYDQQYIRDGSKSYLEVIYNNGLVKKYDGADGTMLTSEMRETPDLSLNEEFLTDGFRVESPLHGTPKVYDRESGKMIAELESDAYLTYFTETEDYLVSQYVTTDNKFYGHLMDKQCHVLAYLPGLCDIWADELLFDYHTGYIRKAKVYELDELQSIAKQRLKVE